MFAFQFSTGGNMSDESLTLGAPAPDFDLESSYGGRASLGNLNGQNVVLFFYPKDDTPG
jgi:peroxiredoxin Q/BCP